MLSCFSRNFVAARKRSKKSRETVERVHPEKRNRPPVDSTKGLEWVLRIALFGTFLGHGWYAFQAIPHFQALLAGATGLSPALAARLLPIIGLIDFLIAGFAILKPIRSVLAYAALWGFLTALARPVSGEAEIWAFIERWPNCGVPLALLLLKLLPQVLQLEPLLQVLQLAPPHNELVLPQVQSCDD